MTTDVQPPPEVPVVPKPRLAKIVRWGTRLTSLPVLALALISLLPTLMSFSVSAPDDKLIALGLCAVCLGFLLAWRWPAIGGGIGLAGLGVVIAHEEGGLAGDSFSIAFALQAVLFLISSVLDLQSDRPAPAAWKLMKGAAIGLLAVCALAGVVMIYRGPGPMPLAREHARYIGLWDSGTGLQFEITKGGEVKVTEATNARVTECNTPVQPGETKVFSATIRGDEHLELTSGALGDSKVYLIERRPHLEGKKMKMTLNASVPYQRTNSLVLVKKEDTKSSQK
jgi:hypothetical protein